MPNEASNHAIVVALFEIGPIQYDRYLSWQELESWQRLMGLELEPWEATLLIDLSKAFFHQREESKSMSSICPWPKGRNMWKYVMDKRHEKQKAEQPKEPNGPSKRHRNPSPR